MNVENRLDLATMVQMQTVDSQEESLESRTGSRPPLHCYRIVINPETERAGTESEVSMSKVFAHLCDHEFRGKLGHIRHFFFL